MGDGSLPAEEAEALIPRFEFKRLLNQDQAGRRISLQGTIDSKPCVLVVERAAFANDTAHVSSLARSLSKIRNLGSNDIYFWFMASSGAPNSTPDASITQQPPDLKVNLIYPCTPKHIKKYSQQPLRTVIETPEIYRKYVRPYMESQRSDGRLDWMYNILEGRTEQDDVFYRSTSKVPEERFLILPDLNWDRKTMEALHVLALVERRDIWSLRDLNYSHLPFLRHMQSEILSAVHKLYPSIEEDQLKLYVHYQPTYYHFHIHVVHVMFEAGATQAVGKAFGLWNLMALLEVLGEGKGLDDLKLSYGLGEESDLWRDVFGPLKRGDLQ